MQGLKKGWAALKAYVAHDDPPTAMANLVALVIVWNQPFYPLYILWGVSPVIWPSFFTFLSTPLFAAVPAISRRSPLAGRVLLCLAGIGNTALSAKVFGVQSGVEIFLIPCALLAVVLFRPTERVWAFGLVGLAFGVYLLRGWYGAPVHLYAEAEYAALVTLNVLSVATLTVFIGLLVAGRIADLEKRG